MTFLEKLRIASQIVTGIQHIHKFGYIHGDLRTENILVSRDMQERIVVKINDFATVRRKSKQSKCNKHAIINQKALQAPEVLEGKEHGYKSDVY